MWSAARCTMHAVGQLNRLHGSSLTSCCTCMQASRSMDQVSVDDSTEDLNHLSISDAGDVGDVNDGDDSSQEEECYVKVSAGHTP